MSKFQDKIIKTVRFVLETVDIAVTRQETFDRLIGSELMLKRYESFLSFVERIRDPHVKQALRLLPGSKSEIFQDIFVALTLNGKRDGFFVEFGATDGITGSNSWVFENNFGWKGLLAEPAHIWHERLANNRNCSIAHDCVWAESGHVLEFQQSGDAGFSTLSDYVESDRHSSRRAEGQKTYKVKTLALDELLKRQCVPQAIDYMSIDTEGSEYDILCTFPIEDWSISIITVEHNFRTERAAINDMLQSKGFVRVLTGLSQFDDWYVNSDLVPRVAAVFSDIGKGVSA